MRSHVLGPDYVQRAFENADELSLPFQELATEFAQLNHAVEQGAGQLRFDDKPSAYVRDIQTGVQGG